MYDSIDVACEREIKKLEKRHGNGIVQAIQRELERAPLDQIGDALGGSQYKIRVPLPGKGKRGGMRAVVAYDPSQNNVRVDEVYQRKER